MPEPIADLLVIVAHTPTIRLGAAVGLLENGETMNQATTLFVSTFTTLLAIINPLESLPVFLRLLQGKDERAHRRVARRACTCATLLAVLFPDFRHVAAGDL